MAKMNKFKIIVEFETHCTEEEFLKQEKNGADIVSLFLTETAIEAKATGLPQWELVFE